MPDKIDPKTTTRKIDPETVRIAIGADKPPTRKELEQKATDIIRYLGKAPQPSGINELITDSGLRRIMSQAHVYEYPKADNTTDAVVFGLDAQAGTLRVLLIKRGRETEPFFGCWALPGGFLNMDEDLDTCVRRELEEETGIKLSYLEQLYTFGRPDRDPRGRVISTAYMALVRPNELHVAAADDAVDYIWVAAQSLPPQMAFDHADIIKKALDRLQSKILWQPIGMELLPDVFTLTALQQVYEIVLGRPLDKRNFRRKVLKMGVLSPAWGYPMKEQGRPAQAYRFDRDLYKGLQEKGNAFEV